MNSKTTLKKISEHLNISVSTVSRALKDHPDIAEETKRKVRELASILEYEPNTYAINLRTNTSRVFGLIVPAISNFFYDSFIAAAEKKSRENGYTLMILQSADDPQVEAENLRLCRLNRVAGIFISLVPGSIPASFTRIEEAGIPVIYFDKVPESDNCNKVCMADEEAAALAATEIIRHQRRKILGVFGNLDFSITRNRLQAFRHAIDAVPGIELLICHCNNSTEAEMATLAAFADKEGIDQVFTISDEILVGVMKALYKLNSSIPSPVAVLAISNGFLPPLFNPSVTYIETSGYALGELAMQRMMDLLAGQTFFRTVIQPARFVEGASM